MIGGVGSGELDCGLRASVRGWVGSGVGDWRWSWRIRCCFQESWSGVDEVIEQVNQPETVVWIEPH